MGNRRIGLASALAAAGVCAALYATPVLADGATSSFPTTSTVGASSEGLNAAPVPAIIKGGSGAFLLKNRGVGTCITSSGGGSGTVVVLYGCNSNAANQQWIWNSNGMLQNEGDGLCINAPITVGNYAKLYMAACSGSQAVWDISEDAQGYTEVESYWGLINTNEAYMFSSEGQTGNNQDLYLNLSTNGPNQQWTTPAAT